MALNLALVISGNATGAKQATAETRAEVQGLGTDAAATSRAMQAANDQALASAQRVTQALTEQTAAQQKMQAAVAAFAGIKPANDDAAYRQRAGDIETYGQELDRLRAKYNPLFAVEQRHLEMLREIDQALKVGAITEQEHAAATTAAGVAHQRQVQLLGNVSGAARLTSAQLLNLSRQGNDVVTMWLLGASAGQIAVSQFGQVYDALESGPKGLRGSLEAIAVAGRNALAALLAFAVTPPGLVAAATVAAVAGLATYIIKTKEDVRDLDDILKDHEKVIKSIAGAYGLVQEKAHGAFSFNTRDSLGLSAAANQSELRLALIKSVQGDLSGLLTNRGGGASGNQFGPSHILAWDSEFAPFADAIDHLRSTARQGLPDILGFKKMVEDRWALDPNNEALARTAIKLEDMVKGSLDAARALKELDEAKRRFEASVGPGGIPLRRGALSTEDMGSYDQYLAAQRVAIERSQQAFDAQRQAIYARSPAEIAAAARAAAAAQYNNEEDPQERTRRINMSGQLAQLQAEHQLNEALKERKQMLDQTMASARLDLALIGQTTAATEAARMQFQLEAQIREEAARNNVAVDQAELARVAQLSAAYGELVAVKQAADVIKGQIDNLTNLRLELLLVGQNETVRARAKAQLEAELQIRRTGIDVYGEEAELMRQVYETSADLTAELKKQADAWQTISDAAGSGIDRLVDSAANGFKDIDDALEEVGKDLLKTSLQMSVGNPLKNWLTGSDLPELGDVKGMGGFLGRLFGRSPADPASAVSSVLAGQSTAMMNVQAAVVNINGGGLGGGLGDNVSRLLGGANDNYAPGAVTRAPLADIGETAFKAAGVTKTGIPLSQIGAQGLFAKVNSAYADRFQGLLNDLSAAGYPIKSLGEGGYSFRNVAGSSNLSNHAFGNALDINPRQNPWAVGAKGNFAQYGIDPNALAEKNGLFWGGNWNKSDAMHFQVDKTVQSLDKLSTSSTTTAQNLSSGLGKLGDALNQFPAAPSGGSGLLGNLLGGLSSAFSGSRAYNWLSANPGGYIGLYADGGWTGYGPKDKPAGVVHAGEIVWSQDDIRRAGGPNVVEAMRLGRRGYAAGGVVEGGYPMAARGAASGSAGYGAAQSEAPQINIYPQAGTEAKTRKRKGPRGGDVTDIIVSAVKQSVADGDLDSTLGGRFGVQPVKARRGTL